MICSCSCVLPVSDRVGVPSDRDKFQFVMSASGSLRIGNRLRKLASGARNGENPIQTNRNRLIDPWQDHRGCPHGSTANTPLAALSDIFWFLA